MTVREAAERLECSAGLVYALVAAGKLRASRVGLRRGHIRICEEAVAEYLAASELGRRAPQAASVPNVKFQHLRF